MRIRFTRREWILQRLSSNGSQCITLVLNPPVVFSCSIHLNGLGRIGYFFQGMFCWTDWRKIATINSIATMAACALSISFTDARWNNAISAAMMADISAQIINTFPAFFIYLNFWLFRYILTSICELATCWVLKKGVRMCTRHTLTHCSTFSLRITRRWV